MNDQQKKLLLAIGLLVIAVGCYIWFNRRGDGLSSSIKYVCVATGERFSIPRDDVNATPWINPKTKEYTLFPVVERDGKLYVHPRYGETLRTDPKISEVNKYVDTRTLEVRAEPESSRP
ncbi:MAG: hypothetical protein JXO22_16330 [Phycisphaerae bacterium]|nr:hypothetical protein [Phycisphaerae bacterium]